MLHHKPQRLRYGCLYHALYALTGDEAWLEHIEDVSTLRWHARLHEAGLMVMTHWNSEVLERPCPPEFWLELRRRLGPLSSGQTHMPLLVTIKGLHGTHIVAIDFPIKDGCPVIISDSAKNALQEMPSSKFLLSPWAAAYAVESIVIANVDVYPEDLGHTHFAAPVNYTM